MKYKKPTLKQMTIEDLQWALDEAIEKNNQKRQESISRELIRRSEYKTV